MSEAEPTAGAEAPGPSIRIEGQATPEEVAAVTAALAVVLFSAGEPEPHEHQSGWVVAARLEAQGHPQISTLRHIAAHASTH